MTGRRVEPREDQERHLQAGEYGKDALDGFWRARPPETELVANLGKHEVTEHEDGTITVSPSIGVHQSNVGTWHGYLERGVWRLAT